MRITKRIIRPKYSEGTIIEFTDEDTKFIIKLSQEIRYVGTIAVVTGYIQNYKELKNKSDFILGSQYTFRFNINQHPIRLKY